MKQETKTLAIVNDQPIIVIENGDRLVPIKPICDALGIDLETQRRKIKQDGFLNSVAGLRPATGKDGKQYEMFCIPFKYVFGWLFTINPANVKEEAREAVMSYRSQCYDVLYRHFTAQSEYVRSIHEESSKVMDAMDEAKEQFSRAKKRLDIIRERYKQIRSVTFEEWDAVNGQLSLFLNNDQDESTDNG